MAKVRSPNYPTISLREAVARVQSVYAKEHKHPADRAVIAKDLGYGSLNGASMSVISALTKYGLLEQVGDQLRVSSRGEDLSIYGFKEPERVAALREAAFRPALFGELHDLYGERLPSDTSLRAGLVKRGFNPNTVDGVIRSYRDTFEFLREESEFSPVEPEDNSELEEPSEIQMSPTRVQFVPSGRGVAAPAAPQSAGPVLTFNIAADAAVRVEFSGHVTQEAIDKLIAMLQLQQDTFPKREAIERVQGAEQVRAQATSENPRESADAEDLGA